MIGEWTNTILPLIELRRALMSLPKKSKTDLEKVIEVVGVPPTMQKFEDGVKHRTTEQGAETPFEFTSLGTAFKTVCEALKSNLIPDYEVRNLLEILPSNLDEQVFDADFDMAEEVTMQLTVLRAVRDKIISIDGRLSVGQTVKDARDLIQSSATLLQLLQKLRGEIINTNRLKAVEDAIIDTLKERDEELKAGFMKELKVNLERIR